MGFLLSLLDSIAKRTYLATIIIAWMHVLTENTSGIAEFIEHSWYQPIRYYEPSTFLEQKNTTKMTRCGVFPNELESNECKQLLYHFDTENHRKRI